MSKMLRRSSLINYFKEATKTESYIWTHDSKSPLRNTWQKYYHLLEWEEEIVKEFEINMYTLLYLKQITIKVLLYSRRNSDQGYVAAWRGGRRMDTCTCTAEPLCHPPETITALLIGYTPI